MTKQHRDSIRATLAGLAENVADSLAGGTDPADLGLEIEHRDDLTWDMQVALARDTFAALLTEAGSSVDCLDEEIDWSGISLDQILDCAATLPVPE